MQTTFDIPDAVLPTLLAASAAEGQSLAVYVVQAAAEKAERNSVTVKALPNRRKSNWRSVFGSVDPAEVAKVQQIIDEEFSQIRPEDWE